MLDTHARKYVEPLISYTATTLINLGLSANTATCLAFIIGVMSGPLVYFHHTILAVLMLWFSGFLDAVDGAIARMTRSTSWGTVMDVTFDRVVELSVILGLAFRFPKSALILLILCGSIVLSMTVFLTVGAVSEKKGKKSFYYQAGFAERTEGFIFLSLMMVFTNHLFGITLAFAFAIIFTVGQRMVEAKKMLDN